MEPSEEQKKKKQFERAYTAVLLLLVAVLLLASISYTTQLWSVKVTIASMLVVVSGWYGRRYWQGR